jgi:2'-5' RNA ligase
MVAFFLPAEITEKLALFNAIFGEADDVIEQSEMHLTLAYLGKAEGVEQDPLEILRVLRAFGKEHGALQATLNGTGQFGTETDGFPYFVTVDCAELPAFRAQLVEALEKAGIPVARTHGYIPHVTLAYTEKPKTNVPVNLDLRFDRMTLAWGDKRMVALLDSDEAQLLDRLQTKLTALLGDDLDSAVARELIELRSKGEIREYIEDNWQVSEKNLAWLLEE